MLTLITGRAGTGKSEYLLSLAGSLAKQGRECVFIVPEQSSFLYEKKLLERTGDAAADLVRVKSFRKLTEDIFKRCGGGAAIRVDEAARTALVRRALISDRGAFSLLGRHAGETEFCASLASAVNELKNAGATPEKLLEISEVSASAQTRQKLLELSRLLSSYDALLESRYVDPADSLKAAAALAGDSGLLDGRVLLIDGFSGFTAPEQEIVSAALSLCADVYAAFGSANGELSAFNETRSTLLWLRRQAGECGIEVEEKAFTENRRFKAAGLAALEGYLCGESRGNSTEGLYAFAAGDIYAECETAAAEIKYLVRKKGWRYRDVAVISRDFESYRIPLLRSFSQYGVPVSCDEGDTALYTPVSVFAKSAFSLLSGPDTDALLSLAGTGIPELSEDEVRELRSYVFTWSVAGDEWLSEFTKNPYGFENRPRRDAASRLLAAECARAKLVGWVETFRRKAAGKTVRETLTALMELFEDCGGAARAESLPKDAREAATAAFSVIERLYTVAGPDTLAPNELKELFSLLASSIKRRDIPSSLDAVHAGAAETARMDNPRAVFVLGMSEGAFPREEFRFRLLTGEERELIAGSGVQLALSYDACADMEELFLYRALTSASERLYLLYSRVGADGGEGSASAVINGFFGGEEPPQPEFLGEFLPYAASGRSARRQYCRLSSNDDPDARYLEKSGFVADAAALRTAASAPEYAVDDRQLMLRLLGDEASVSPSKAELFYSCAFAYFLRYALGIKPKKPAELSPMEAGSYIHAVLEAVVRKTEGRLCKVSERELFDICDEASAAFVRDSMGDISNRPRLLALSRRLAKQTKRLAGRLRLEQLQSRYEIAAAELAVRRGGEIQPMCLEAPDGEKIYIEGQVDRADVFEQDGKKYLRVVDYKTGSKSFSLDDVCYGLNMQMLIYLFSLKNSKDTRFNGALPAGVLYMPADPAPPDEKDGPASVYCMTGLLLNDDDSLKAMEADLRGDFIPVNLKRDGTATGSIASQAVFEKLEKQVKDTLTAMAGELYGGRVDACPTREKNKEGHCRVCEYSAVCRRDRVERFTEIEPGRAEELFGE